MLPSNWNPDLFFLEQDRPLGVKASLFLRQKSEQDQSC